MKTYTQFANVYDRLMQDVDYVKLCDQMLFVSESFGHRPHLVLDAACGTGSFTLQLATRKLDVIGVDQSPEMLAVARKKLQGTNTLLLCQDLKALDLYGTVDTAFCTLDGLNHITNKNDLVRILKKIALFLDPGGLFLFDVNTVYKHKKILGNNIFVSEENGIYLVWQNRCRQNTVTMDMDVFVNGENGYTRICEQITERAYSHDELCGLLQQAGLYVLKTFDFNTMRRPGTKSEKIIYVVRKEL